MTTVRHAHDTNRERGFTLLETMIALTMLLIVAAGIVPLGLVAVKASENQGHLGARTTEYAQDKLEQLMALAYADSTSDTRVSPATTVNGSGLSIGGSADPDAPVNQYVDYLDVDGNLLASGGAAPAGWYYKRVWQVSPFRANLKRIDVTAIVRVAAQGGIGELPRSSVTALKTNPF